jgi:formate dehydrogenase (coenzyme F420) beta subunit
MSTYTEKIRETAQRLLKECRVDMVIGFRQGSQPMMNEPCMVRKPEDVQQLVWDSNCGINLANYITGRKERIGVIRQRVRFTQYRDAHPGKQDQTRTTGGHRRTLLGMIDKRKIAAATEGEILEVDESGDQITIKTSTGTKTFAKRRRCCSKTAACAPIAIR